jgi:hypothetical protein
MKLLLCLIGLIMLMGCKQQEGSTHSTIPDKKSELSKEQLVEKYFPKKSLPLEVNPYDVVSPANVIAGKDKAKMFPYATDGDIHAVAQIDLFPGHTTIIYREDWLYNDTYIVTYEKGSFSINKANIIADVFTDGEGTEGYNVATIEKNGLIKRSGTTDNGETFEAFGTYKYTSDNELHKK